MKDSIKKGITFVRNNPTIIYSLSLIFVVVLALFLNSYVIIGRFQENLDRTLRTKAVLAEDVISVLAKEYFSSLSENKLKFEEKIKEIQKKDLEITEIAVFGPSPINGEYLPLISIKNAEIQNGETSEIDRKISQNAIKFALSVEDAFAYLSNSDGKRYWNVVKAVRSDNGNVEGVLSLRLSLEENDLLVTKTIFQVYLLSVGAVLVVLLLVFNHIRLFGFEVRAKKLEEIDRMKDDFISMASHELKSPLTAINGYVELLGETLKARQEENGERLQQEKYLNNINVSTNRLKTLVEDLLDVSRIEQNRMPVNSIDVDLVKSAIEIVDEMKILADEKGLKIKFDMPGVSMVSADPDRLKQIIVNLISNAIKYMPSGEVRIRINEDMKNVYLTVTDTGLGISAQNMKNLFSKFYRVKNEHTAGIGGTGLGLWIAKEIAQKMGGDLKAESIEGEGSHFTLNLKKSK